METFGCLQKNFNDLLKILIKIKLEKNFARKFLLKKLFQKFEKIFFAWNFVGWWKNSRKRKNFKHFKDQEKERIKVKILCLENPDFHFILFGHFRMKIKSSPIYFCIQEENFMIIWVFQDELIMEASRDFLSKSSPQRPWFEHIYWIISFLSHQKNYLPVKVEICCNEARFWRPSLKWLIPVSLIASQLSN